MELGPWMGKPTLLVLYDGRILVGLLRGFDPQGNVVLSNTHERIYSKRPSTVASVDNPKEEEQAGEEIRRKRTKTSNQAREEEEGREPTQKPLSVSITGVQVEQLGAMLVRGDYIVLIGGVEPELDSQVPYERIQTDPIRPIAFR